LRAILELKKSPRWQTVLRQQPAGLYSGNRKRKNYMNCSTIPPIRCVLALTACLLVALPAAADQAWKPLMDGKTLAGWHPVGDGKWTVEDGVFVGRANKEKLYGLLVSDKQFKNFTVRFKFKSLTGDSGFYIRTIIKEPEKAHGLQVQVGPPNTGSGGIYESYGRKWIPAKPAADFEKQYLKPNDWNEYVVIAREQEIILKVNGAVFSHVIDREKRDIPNEGLIALQLHRGPPMKVQFKSIRIKHFP